MTHQALLAALRRGVLLMTAAILGSACSDGTSSGVEGEKPMSKAGAAEIQALCTWAESQLATTKGTQCDMSIEDGVAGCVADLQKEAAEKPTCAKVTFADLERCVSYVKSDPCLTNEAAGHAACDPADPCIGLGSDDNPPGPTSKTGIPLDTSAAALSDPELTTLCQYISGIWSATSGSSCDISFGTVADCKLRIEDRRATGSCAQATIEDLERCTEAMLDDSCFNDLTKLNQDCGNAIDCLIPRGG